MANRSLNVQITGDAKGLGVAARQADGHMDGLGKSATRMGKVMALGFATAGAAAAGALAVGLKKSVDAAIDAEKSQARLQAQLKASGLSFRAHAHEIDAVIQKHSQLAGIDDEDLQDAFTNLVRSTGSVNTAMKDMTLITDIARARHMDVAKAADLVGKVHNGAVTALNRYGAGVDKNATSQEALAKLQQKFAGQAEAYGKTAAGAQERFGVAVENLQEKIGSKLLPVVTDITNKVATFVGQMESGKGAGGRFADRISEGFAKVKAVAEAVWPVLRDGGKVALDLLATGFGRLKTIIEAATPTFLKVKDAAVQAFGWLKENVPRAIDAVKGAVSTAASAVSGAFGTIKDVIGGAVRFVRGWINKHRDDIEAFGHAWKNVAKIVVGAVGVLVAGIKLAIDHVYVPVMKVALSVVKAVWPSIQKVIAGALEAIGGIIDVFSGIFTGDFSRIWDGVKGIFRGGVKSILGILGGILKGVPAALSGLGGILKDLIVDSITFAARNVPKLIGKALGGLGHAITEGIKAGFGKLNPFGDGLGDGLGVGMIGGAGLGGGSLMGAKSIMSPFASAAGRFGLHTTSGLRPGAITSSGNVSLHASGNAVDEAGSPAGMMGYFNFLKNTMGSKLSELIYTPGGVGIKNGQPYRYTGTVAADHYDHVHVGFTGGVGDGIGAGPGRSRKDEMGWLSQQWSKVAPAFGLDSKTPLGSMFKHIKLSGSSPFVGVTTDVGKGMDTAELLWPSWLWRGGDGQKPLDDKTKLKLFIHEMAHRFQGSKVWNGPAWKSEGGAEAFARLSMDRFFGGYSREHDDPYSGYTTRVVRDMGIGWVTGGQFGRKPGTGDGIGEIRNLWTRDGGNPAKANIAAAIAMAESGGNPNASNRNSNGSIDRGLWQINSVHGALSTFSRDGNARAAIRISGNGTNWNPWTVFKTGAYKRFLSGSSGSSGGSGGSGGGSSTSSGQAAFGAGQTKALNVVSTATKAAHGLVGPGQGGYDQRISDIGVGLAENKGNAKATIGLLVKEGVEKQNRLAKVKAALKRRLRPETRKRLTDEAAQLIEDLNALSALVYDLSGGQMGISSDGIQGGTAAAAADIAGAGGSSGTGGTADVDPGPTHEDYIRANIAGSRLTDDGNVDDLLYASELRDFLKGEMDKALADGDPRNDPAAIDAYLAAADAVKALTDASKAEAAATAANTEALKGVQDELKRQTDFAESASNTSNFQLTKTLADLVSGQIVGYGVAGRAFTPGVGVDRAY